MSVTKGDQNMIDLNDLSKHDSIRKSFSRILNILKPEHEYISRGELYPIEPDQISYSHKKSTSMYYAACAPRASRENPVFFAADRTAFQNKSAERVLAICVHELTHLKIGSYSNYQGGSHPPVFWSAFVFNAHKAISRWTELEKRFGTLSQEDFIGYIISQEVNRFNVDRRYHSVRTLEHQVARWLKNL